MKLKVLRQKKDIFGIFSFFGRVSFFLPRAGSLLIVLAFLVLSGCASVPRQDVSPRSIASEYTNIEAFCRKHNFEYSFDTIDDVIKIYSPNNEIKLLLNSHVGVFSGATFNLKNKPLYFKGEIFVPLELEKIISSEKFVVFKPLFDMKTVVIDPGHGGKDPGAISAGGLREKTVNLEISKYLKKELEKQGLKVMLTRLDDVFLTLKERVDIAKKFDADLFISIHANANHSKEVKGVEIYYLSPSRLDSRERAVKLAKTERFQGRNIPFEGKAILWDMVITKNHSFSVEFTDILYYNFKNLSFKVKAPKKAPFYVLRFAYVPSVLVEVGYLSNFYEEKALRKKYYQKQIAEAIAMGVSSFKKRYSSFDKLAEIRQ